jgi:hypothetical protein
VVPIYDVLPKSFRYVDAFFEAYELFSSTKDLSGNVGGGFHQGLQVAVLLLESCDDREIYWENFFR